MPALGSSVQTTRSCCRPFRCGAYMLGVYSIAVCIWSPRVVECSHSEMVSRATSSFLIFFPANFRSGFFVAAVRSIRMACFSSRRRHFGRSVVRFFSIVSLTILFRFQVACSCRSNLIHAEDSCDRSFPLSVLHVRVFITVHIQLPFAFILGTWKRFVA